MLYATTAVRRVLILALRGVECCLLPVLEEAIFLCCPLLCSVLKEVLFLAVHSMVCLVECGCYYE